MSQLFLDPLSPTFTNKPTIQKFIKCPNVPDKQAHIPTKQNIQQFILSNVSMSPCPEATKQKYTFIKRTAHKNFTNVPIFRTKRPTFSPNETL